MNPVYSPEKYPDRHLHVREVVALHQHTDVGQAVRIIRNDMARSLAQKIVESPTFFWEKGSVLGGVSYVEYGADCIVLTRQEYLDLQREGFQRGVEHAQGYIRGPL